MKDKLKDFGITKLVGGIASIIGIILLIVASFLKVKSTIMILAVIGLVLLLVGGFTYLLKVKDHRILKMLAFLSVVAIIISWVLPMGMFQGIDFYEQGVKRIGLSDLGSSIYLSLYLTMDKVLFLIILSGVYGVLSKTNAYNSLVNTIAKKLKNKTILTAVLMSFLIVVLTSFLNQPFVVLTFIPFLMAILLNMKVDKLTTFAITFGSILIGIMGATYGTDSLKFFGQQIGAELKVGLSYRVIISIVSFFLYNFFICMRLKKTMKEKNNEDMDDVAFAIENSNKKSKKLSLIILMSLFTLFIIIAFIDWKTYFNIEAFQKLHELLSKVSLGQDFTIISYIMGSNFASPQGKFLGMYDLISLMVILLIFVSLVALFNKIKLQDFAESFADGIKKMVKPILCLLGVYFVFALCYTSPFMPTITNWSLNLVKGLNPYITSVVAFITSLFHADLGYTGYSVGPYLAAVYPDKLSIVHTIYFAMYGLVQVCMPTSVIALIGLSLMNIDYKSWLKYIWIFAVSMFVILLVLFTVLVYI